MKLLLISISLASLAWFYPAFIRVTLRQWKRAGVWRRAVAVPKRKCSFGSAFEGVGEAGRGVGEA